MLPASIPTVTVRARFLAFDGTPLTGQVIWRAPALVTFPDADVMLSGPVAAELDASGECTVRLPATNAPGMNPSGWPYTVTEQLVGVPANRSYPVLLPSSSPSVDLADLAPTDPTTPNYIPIVGSAYHSGTTAPAPALGSDTDLYVQYQNTTVLGVTSTTVTTWQKSEGTWTALGDVRGAAWYVNNTGTSSVGTRPGDLLLRTDSGEVYQRGVSGWGAPMGNLRGPKGLDGAATTWRRRDLPDPALADSLYAGTAPTIATTQTTTPNSGYVRYVPDPVALAGADVRALLTVAGATSLTAGAGADAPYVAPASRYPNTWGSQAAWAIEFGTDAATVQVQFKHVGAASMYRLSIDGRKVADLPQPSGGSTVAGHMLTINLGSSAPRHIRLDLASMPIAAVCLPPTATMWRTPLTGGRFMVFGDSISDGWIPNAGAAQGSWVPRVARLLGASDVWNQSRAGTGFINDASWGTFGSRLAADVIAHAPDRLIVFGGYNDAKLNTPTTETATAAADILTRVKAGVPACETIMIGCWAPTYPASASVTATDTALRTVAKDAAVAFISPVTGAIYDPAGNLVATHGPWTTAGSAAYITDTVHPNDAGHHYLARRIAGALRALMPA